MSTVRELLMLTHPVLAGADDMGDPPDGFTAREYSLFISMASRTGIFDDVLAATGEALLAMSPRERASVISTARTQSAFLDSGPLRAVLRGGTLRMADLKRGKATVYLCLPASRMATHARWFRVIVNTAMTVFEQEPTVPATPVLMVLDEFPILGTMPRLEAAAGQIASFGVKLFVIVQDLTQLQRHYKESWETFLGNAGTVLFFGNSDVTTVKYVSEKLGGRGYKLVEASKAALSAQLAGASPLAENLRVDPLLAPHEVERHLARETDRVLGDGARLVSGHPAARPLLCGSGVRRHDRQRPRSMSVRAPTTTKGSHGLPIVSFTTRERIEENVSAKEPRRQLLALVALIVVFNIMVYPWAAGSSSAPFGFSMLISVVACAIIAGFYFDMPGHYTRNPQYKLVEHEAFIGAQEGGLVLFHTVEKGGTAFPYDGKLSFTVGTWHEWFANPSYIAWANKNQVPNPHVIVARDVTGALVPIAINIGPHADIANIHAALTKAFVTAYSQNMHIVQDIIASAAKPSALPAPGAPDPDKPAML